jgi:hypothetical protein
MLHSEEMMQGAIAMASIVAFLFFLRFWRETGDRFFVFFALAFALDAGTRIVLGVSNVPDETLPLYYIPRLFSFALILIAVIDKNRTPRNTLRR